MRRAASFSVMCVDPENSLQGFGKVENQIISAYFDDFVDAFSTLNGQRVAGKFSIPYMVQGESGECTVFQSHDEVSRHFQAYLDEYEAKGCSQCRYKNLDVKWLGSESALASVDWELLDQSGISVIAWSESYLLSVLAGQVRAFASIDHVGS